MCMCMVYVYDIVYMYGAWWVYVLVPVYLSVCTKS